MTRALTGHPADMVMPPAPALPPARGSGIGAATNTAFAGPWGVSFTANLTPDPETGLGKWTEEMFIATMKTGRHEGKGRPLLPPMPFWMVGGARATRTSRPVRVSAVAAAGEEPRAAADRSGRRRSGNDARCCALAAAGRCAMAWRAARCTLRRAAREPLRAARLSETGLYAGEHARTRSHAANRPFSPQYPLWSDGAAKARWIYLPPGTAIDATDPSEWAFPVGTRFWKEFTFGGRKVETRFLWRASAGRWVFATLRLERGADRCCIGTRRRRPRTSPRSRRDAATTSPAANDCRACHGVEAARTARIQRRCSSRPIAIRTRFTASRSRRG